MYFGFYLKKKMKVNQAVWDGLKKQIEHHTEQDNFRTRNANLL